MAWFWSSSAELAASVPRTDVVGKNEYFRFGMRDSLAIEASFLQVALVLNSNLVWFYNVFVYLDKFLTLGCLAGKFVQ